MTIEKLLQGNELINSIKYLEERNEEIQARIENSKNRQYRINDGSYQTGIDRDLALTAFRDQIAKNDSEIAALKTRFENL